MTDRKHFPAIADSARAVVQSLNAFIKAKRDCKATLLSDELLHEFMVRQRALRQRMIDAGCFEEKERVPVFPLEGPAHAALLTLAADLAGADDRLPGEIEVFASRLSAVVDALTAAGTPSADSTVTPPGLDPTRFRHGPDFRSCHWFGTDYTFTAMQAACVKVLWEAWNNGTPEVGQQTILETANLESARLKDLFKDHAAWGTMIVEGSTNGAFRLAEPN